MSATKEQIEEAKKYLTSLHFDTDKPGKAIKTLVDALTARDAAIRTDEQQKAAKKKAELLDAAKAYKDLCTCYRIGKQPTEKLFSRLEKANAVIMAEAKEAQR